MTKREARRNLKIAEVLREAADIMQKKTQWCQGTWGVCKPIPATGTGSRRISKQPSAGIVTTPSQQSKIDKYIEKLYDKLGSGNDDIDPEDYGQYVEANSPKAVAWCVQGAIYKAAPNFLLGMRAIRALDTLTNQEFGMPAMRINDSNGDASRKKLRTAALKKARQLEREAEKVLA